MKVLMVCLGNICRSPLAEGILKEKVRQYQLDWQVDSAGTGSWHVGQQPDPRSVQIARTNGIDILDQRARQFQPADFHHYDLILAMDSSNYQNILQLAPDKALTEKVELIMNYAHPGENRNVPDPYWEDGGFAEVYRMLDEACEELIRRYLP